jgi:hypothetical protein
MNKELQAAFEWLERRHQTMKELAESNEQFKSDYMRGIAAGEAIAVKYYGEEIEKIRQLLDGYLVEDVDLSGGEKHVS